MDPWDRTESPETDPFMHRQPACETRVEVLSGEKKVFNEWCWRDGVFTCRGMKPDLSLTTFTKTNLKQIKDLNIRHKTVSPPEENTEKKLLHIGFGNFFLI